MNNLIDMLDRAASRAPEKAAVIDEARTLTFSAWRDVARRVAAHVDALAGRPRVGILLPSGTGFAVSFFGTLMAGRVPVPLNFLLTPAELAGCARDAGIDVILTASPLEATARALVAEVLLIDRPDVLAGPPIAEPARPAPGDVAVLLYTSGTTAEPKGVLLTHANLLANAEACRRAAALHERHVLLGLLPLFHTLGLTGSLILPVHLAATTILVGRFQPTVVLETLERHRPSVMIAVPSIYGVLLRTGALASADLSFLELCIAGGEPLPAAVSDAFLKQTGCPLLEGYGLTEMSPVVTLNRPDDPHPGTAGPPLPGVEVRVVDETGADVPTAGEGEVWIRGPSVMPGYHNRPAETAEVLTGDGWFKSGDLGRLDEAGCLAVTGRLKDLIICGGENVAPREVEEVLLAHPAVAEAAVIGVPDALRGEVPKAFVVLRDGGACSAADLRAHCRERLANFKVPRDVAFRPDLPKTPTGKVHRRALREAESP